MKKAGGAQQLRGFVQIDEIYWGGKRSGCKHSRGSENKTPFVAALERNEKGNPVFIRFSQVDSFSSGEMLKCGQKHLVPKSVIGSDGLACFKSFNNIVHFQLSVKTTGRYKSSDFTLFNWLNTVIGNVKNSITGTYHGMSHWHYPLLTTDVIVETQFFC